MLCIIFVLGQARLLRLPHNVLALRLLIFFFFSLFCLILRSTRCFPRLSRSEPTAEHARHIHIQRHLGVHRRHAGFLLRRKTGTTRTGRANVRGTRGKGYAIDPVGRAFSFTEVVEGKMRFFLHFMGVSWSFAPPASSTYHFHDLLFHNFGYPMCILRAVALCIM
jgi:hypothetical protein